MKQKYWDLLKKTYKSWSNDNASRIAAALAYYTAFTMAPFLIICIAIAGFVLGKDTAHAQILGAFGNLLGTSSAMQLNTMIKSAELSSSGSITTVIGIVFLIVGASGLFAQLQEGLNSIWGVRAKPGRSLYLLIKARFLSFTMVIGVGFLLLVSLVISTLVTAFGSFMHGIYPGLETIWLILDFIISLSFTVILLAMIFKVLPDILLEWRNVWIGAITTAILFTIGKFFLEIYLTKSSIASAYGAAGSLLVILVWVYYSSQILFFGAEFTKVYALKQGVKIVPTEYYELVNK